MNDIDHIILHALQGTATEAQLATLEAWIQASPANDHTYQALVSHWHLEGPVDQAQLARIWARVEAGQAAPAANPTPSSQPPSWLRTYRWHIAAVLLALLGIRGILWYQQEWREVVVRTRAGETRELVLADSTEVMLNANSRLSYRKGAPRQVALQGEAYFKVRKKPATGERFLVQTSDLEVEVLGTVFNVHTRSGATEVFLEEGQVRLGFALDSLPPVIMDPGELVTYAPAQGTLARTRPVSALPSSWKDGAIIMEMVSVPEVLTRIEAVYSITIELGRADLAHREVTLAFPVEDLELALKTLETVLGEEVIPQGDRQYIIR
ncbi:MAG: DUF4974 domain-containing protein [Bacteroidetes bacterium]|nr:MAG: DUF4974 domain-containing protein [Bacteroidota bacterium]